MKKYPLAAIILFLSFASEQKCSAQYGQQLETQRNSKLNMNTYNPNWEPIYTVDSTLNHMDFGKHDSKRAIVTLFPFKSISDNNPSKFNFKPSQIMETKMTDKRRISKVELTPNGFAVTFNPKNVKGVVDEYIGIYTQTGTLFLWLTGEIIDPPKQDKKL